MAGVDTSIPKILIFNECSKVIPAKAAQRDQERRDVFRQSWMTTVPSH